MDGASVPSKATQYQLDVVDLAGGVTPLWASAPVPGGIFPPTNFFLSSGSLSEVVLGVSNAGGAEFTIFNEVGMADRLPGDGDRARLGRRGRPLVAGAGPPIRVTLLRRWTGGLGAAARLGARDASLRPAAEAVRRPLSSRDL